MYRISARSLKYRRIFYTENIGVFFTQVCVLPVACVAKKKKIRLKITQCRPCPQKRASSASCGLESFSHIHIATRLRSPPRFATVHIITLL